MPAIEQREIANLLDKTQAAHGAYEGRELNGVYDQAWPAWYAATSSSTGLVTCSAEPSPRSSSLGCSNSMTGTTAPNSTRKAGPTTMRPSFSRGAMLLARRLCLVCSQAGWCNPQITQITQIRLSETIHSLCHLCNLWTMLSISTGDPCRNY